jgi:mRNA interferase YafQ
MRTVESTTRFRRDFKREKKGWHRETLDVDLLAVMRALMFDQILAPRYCDHALTGDWKGWRDCHLYPDLVLIYKLAGADRLVLARLGSHSELDL